MSNPLESYSDGELSDAAYAGKQAGIDVEMMRRLKKSLERSNRAMGRLTWVIAICTVLLLIAAGIQIYLTITMSQ